MLFYYSICVLVSLVATASGSTISDQELHPFLLSGRAVKGLSKTNYNRFIGPRTERFTSGPRKKRRGPVKVIVNFGLLNIISVDAVDESATFAGYFGWTWIDNRLRWELPANHSEAHFFNSLTMTTVAATEVWMPRITLANSLLTQRLSSDQSRKLATGVRVYKNGKVQYFPTGPFKVYCNIELMYFPFDVQSCTLHIDMTLTKSDSVVFESNDGGNENSHIFCTRMTRDGGAWEVVGIKNDITLRYPGDSTEEPIPVTRNFDFGKFPDPDTYTGQIIFHIVMKRKWTLYAVMVIFPSVMLSTFQLFFFFLRIEDQRKLAMCMQILLIYSIFQLSMTPMLPISSGRIPILLFYMGSLNGITVLLVIENIFICNVLQQTEVREVPQLLWKLISSPLGLAFLRSTSAGLEEVENPEIAMLKRANILCVPDDEIGASIMNRTERLELIAEGGRQRRRAWIEVAKVIDFYMFIYFTIVVIAMPVYMFVYLPETVDLNLDDHKKECYPDVEK